MMTKLFHMILIAALSTMIAVGCASKGNNPTLPSTGSNNPSGVEESSGYSPNNRILWGIWEITISSDRETVEVIPARIADMHLNVVHLLEVAPCHTCLTIEGVHAVEPNVIEADVTLTHPYPGLLKYTGFDVRGIFISGADFTFPVSGREIAWGDGVPRMLNPDGYTALFNPTEYPPTKPAALGYIPGKSATGGDLSATLNPFVAYRKDAPRRMFEAGGSETKTVRIHVPPGPIHLGYAVDACWQLVENVVDPLKDFPPDANCLEAYRVSVDLPYDLNSSWMSQNPINVEVFGHQGIDTISSVTVEAPDLFSGETALAYSTQTGEESWLFSGMITNETAATQGNYPLLVKVTDSESDQNLGTIHGWGASIARVKKGWARTWGETDDDYGDGAAVDGSGNVYVTGCFYGTADFDPGPDVNNRVSNGGFDAFLTKFDSSGNFIWARTWGGTDEDYGCGAAVDGSGNVYVTGYFEGAVDFDPGPDVDNHMSNGLWDTFLTKFDSNGNFIWARTWGGTVTDYGKAAAVDGSGNVYVAGEFEGTVDFDTGPDVDNHVSNGWYDTFLTQFDSSGNFIWARTWGETDDDSGYGVAVDGSGNVFVTGRFEGTADFDPGPDLDSHMSNGTYDAFLTKLDSSGNYIWARTWGGTGGDCGYGAAVDGSGNVYVTGGFHGTVDFDPGPDVDNHVSNGGHDAFVTKFDSGGNYIGARTWGGTDFDYGFGAAVDGWGDVYVTGYFSGTVDFDPGPDVDNHVSNGFRDTFLTKFDSSGNFVWARTWGGTGFDYGNGVAVDGSGNAYVTGMFEDEVDFDPGPGMNNQVSNGYDDAFLSKFPPDGNW